MKLWDCLLLKKCERRVSSGSYQAVNARKFKRGNVMEKKGRGKEKGGGKNTERWVVVEMSRWSEIDHI